MVEVSNWFIDLVVRFPRSRCRTSSCASLSHWVLDYFEPTKEDWRSYTERLEQYFVANDVQAAETAANNTRELQAAQSKVRQEPVIVKEEGASKEHSTPKAATVAVTQLTSQITVHSRQLSVASATRRATPQGLVEARVRARRHLPRILTRSKRKVKTQSHMSFWLGLRDRMSQSQCTMLWRTRLNRSSFMNFYNMFLPHSST